MMTSRLPTLVLASFVISAPAILLTACKRSADETQGTIQNTGVLSQDETIASSTPARSADNPGVTLQNTDSLKNTDSLSQGSYSPGRETASVTSTSDPRGATQDTDGLSQGPGAPGKGTGSVTSTSDPRGATQDTDGLSQGPDGTDKSSMSSDTRSVGTSVKDASITALVKSKLLADPDVSGLRIDVDTRDKVVTLSGTVADQKQVARAASLAAEADGVSSVNNRLLVAVK